MSHAKRTNYSDIGIIGSGPAGLMAANVLAGHGASFLVFEKSRKTGGLIPASGNGRCNFTNTSAAAHNFNNPQFAENVLGPSPSKEVISDFHTFGVLPTTIEDRVYPRTLSAQTILQSLLSEEIKESIYIETEVKEIYYRKDKGLFQLKLGSDKSATVSELLITTGSQSLELAEMLGHTIVPLEPRLCPLQVNPINLPTLKTWNGVRIESRVSLIRKGNTIWTDEGEVLFRHYGLSGIVIFDASRFAHKGDTIIIDAVPELTQSELSDHIKEQLKRQSSVEQILNGCIHPKLAKSLSKYLSQNKISAQELAHTIKHLSFTVTGFETSTRPQVMRGGISTAEVNPKTLESKLVPHLYFAGEVLDIDGACGGYNLTWAWLSGKRAAQSIIN